MSDTKRTIDAIHKDYSQKCMEAGHVQFQIAAKESEIRVLKQQLDSLNVTLSDLNLEAAKVAAEPASA